METEQPTNEYWFFDFFNGTNEAWRRWEIASCEEWNGGHDWTVNLYYEEDVDHLDLYCANCPATGYDFWSDYTDIIYGQLGNVTIDACRHNCTEDTTLKVNVKLHVEKYNYYYGTEYDVWIELTPRE